MTPSDIAKKGNSTLSVIGYDQMNESPPEREEDVVKNITQMISGFSLGSKIGGGEGSLTPYPIRKGENDYSSWRAELRRMSPEIEETLTSIWRVALITDPVELTLAKFEAEM